MEKEKWLFDNIMLLYSDLGKDYQVELENISIISEDNYFQVWLKSSIPILLFKIEVNYSFFKDPEYKFEPIRVIKTGLSKHCMKTRSSVVFSSPLEFAYDFIKPIVRDFKLNKLLTHK
jgi:hypothetical protein